MLMQKQVRETATTKNKVVASAKLLAHAVKSNITPNVGLERERLTSLINSMGDGVLAIDEKFKIVVSNGAALNILDVNTTLTGKKLSDVLHMLDKNNHELDLIELISKTRTSHASREWRIKYSDGSTVNLYVSIAPVRLGFGQQGMRGYVILLRDITREKSLEEERDEFISVVSHELRTPIAIAEGNIGNAEFILEKSGLANKEIQGALQQAHDQVDFLAGLINDLATLSRAERGKLQVDVESINAYELLKDLLANYTPQAEAKKLTISCQPDPKLELLLSSKLYVREILQNFITNAIKYTEKGGVSISASSKPNGIEFRVSDTGIGISKPDQEKVFEKFFRSEDYRTRQNTGTGLGLYVTMKLASLIHAKISVESELNKGSTFTIFIPNLQ